MHPLIETLTRGGPVLTDGAWGTQLQARGLAIGEIPEAWNLTRPAAVREVAQAYIEAGSRVVLTNTFGGNRIRLAEAGLADRLEEINRLGAAISREAAGARARVFASLGPTGRLLAGGEVDVEEIRAAFLEQAWALARGGADALIVETMSDLQEARLAVAAARETGLPVVACMVFDSGPNRDRTMTGVTPEESARALAGAGADVVGANCGQGIREFVPLCRRLRAATERPLWIKPNAGLPELSEGRAVYRTSPAEFAAFAPALVEGGAAFLGGCCGTGPDFIRALAAALSGAAPARATPMPCA